MQRYRIFYSLLFFLSPLFADAGLHIVGTNTLNTADLFKKVALQSDGKVIVVGKNTSSTGMLVRYTSDGVLDTSFGTAGIVNDSSASNYFDVAIQSDGKIVVVGQNNDTPSTGVIARYNSDGTLDTDYGTGGKKTDAGAVNYSGVALQSDGKAVVVGQTFADGAVIARYSTTGSLDGTYGTVGKATDAGASYYTGIALQTDGKAVVVGKTTGEKGKIARYTTSGLLDNTYGTDGETNDTGANYYNNVVLQSDGKAVIAGKTTGGNGLIARYGTSGALDGSYGTSGKAINLNAADYISLAIQTEDDYVVAVGNTSDPNAIIGRYDTDGDLDTNFDTDGTTTNTNADYYNGVAVQSDGKIVTVGDTGTIGIIARYTETGSLDTGTQTVATLVSFVDLTSGTYLKDSGTTLDLSGGTIVGAGESKLAALTGLDGSLDGITKANITTLKLGANLLTAIPASIFSTFTNLETLELQDNTSLVTLNANSFSGLNLTDLRLDGNTSLVTLPASVFNGLSLSGTLNFSGNTAFTTFSSGWNTGFTCTGNFKLNGCSSLATIPSDFYTTCMMNKTITGDIRLDGIAVTSFPENAFEGLIISNDLKIDSNTALTTLNKRMFKNTHIGRDLDISGCTALTTIHPLCLYNGIIVRNVDLEGTTLLVKIPFNLFQAALISGSILLNNSGAYSALPTGADKTALAAGVSALELKKIIQRHHGLIGALSNTKEHAELVALYNKTLALNHANQR